MTDAELYKFWTDELEREERLSKDWRKECEDVHDIWRSSEDKRRSFNILWANVEILLASLLSNTPKPDVRRRYLDADPEAKQVAVVLERALSYVHDMYPFRAVLKKVIIMFLVPGFGTSRLRYRPYFDTETQRIPVEPREETGEEGEPVINYYHDEELVEHPIIDAQGPHIMSETEELVYEEVYGEPIPWKRLHWEPGHHCWSNVRWAAIDHYLTKEQIIAQFGKKMAEKVRLDAKRPGVKDDVKDMALIREIFDKKTRTIYVMSAGLKDEFIAKYDDPLGIKDFFPFPEPLMANVPDDEMTPRPDYAYYEEQAKELEKISRRIQQLTDALKIRGVYDSAFELANVLRQDDNELTPIENFAEMFQGKGDLSSILAIMPTDQIVSMLRYLYEAREQAKGVIYEIYGLSDIIRGQSKASETATAQSIKSEYNSLRLKDKRDAVQEFIRNYVRLEAEIIAEHFSAETLSLITGMDVTDEMVDILRDDFMRSYRIDIETDSTVAQDEKQEQMNRVEFMNALSNLLQQLMPATKAGVMSMEVAKEMIAFTMRAFKVGRQLEDAIDEMGQAPPPGPPGGAPAGAPAGAPGEMPPEGMPDQGMPMPSNVMPMR